MAIGVGVSPAGELQYVVRGAPPPLPLPVESVLDSWQLDDEWWRHRISRRYVEVMVAGGKRMLVFEDLVTGEWYEQTP